MRILGIDPGLCVTGYAVIEEASSFRCTEAGVIRTRRSDTLGQRLKTLFDGVSGLIADTRPGIVVLEKIFAHGQHPATALLMGHARGSIYLAAENQGVEVFNIPPTRVKKAVLKHGHAGKQQIQKAVMFHLKLKRIPQPADVADAMAIALAYAFTGGKEVTFKNDNRRMSYFVSGTVS